MTLKTMGVLCVGLALVASNAWAAAGPSMLVPRRDFASADVAGNKTMVCGGFDGTSVLASCEIFNPGSCTWETTGSMNHPRRRFTMAVLPKGRVLAAGGETTGGKLLDLAEVWSPDSGQWTPANGWLADARKEHSAVVLLLSGNVLLSGGEGAGGTLDSAELFDPVTLRFNPTGAMTTPRRGHFLVNDNRGRVIAGAGRNGTTVLGSFERYDPAAGTWESLKDLLAPRADFAITGRLEGFVILTGGTGQNGEILDSVEAFSPDGGDGYNWSEQRPPLPSARRFHSVAASQSQYGFWVAGGEGPDGTKIASTDFFRLHATETGWVSTGVLPEGRVAHGALLVGDDRMLVYGGEGQRVLQTTAAILLTRGQWRRAASLSEPRTAAVTLKDGRVLAMGEFSSTVELYDPYNNAWSVASGSENPLASLSAVLLDDGRVLVIGVERTTSSFRTQLYDPDSGTWNENSMVAPLSFSPMRLVLMANGKVLVCCDKKASMLFHPLDGSWGASIAINGAEGGGPMVLLSSGDVLMVSNGPNGTIAEIYSPLHGAWSQVAPPPAGQSALVALTGDRALLVSNGEAERYDKAHDSWSPAGYLWQTSSINKMVGLSPGILLAASLQENPNDTDPHSEIFEEGLLQWLATPTMQHQHPALALLNDSTALALGDLANKDVTTERYTIADPSPFCSDNSGDWSDAGGGDAGTSKNTPGCGCTSVGL